METAAAAAAAAGLDSGGPSTMKNEDGRTREERFGVENRPRFVPAYPPRGRAVRASRVQGAHCLA